MCNKLLAACEFSRDSSAHLIILKSNNMIIHSLVRHFKKTRSSFAPLSHFKVPHVITSNIEHNSIVLTLKDLHEDEHIELTIVPVSKATGSVSAEEVVSAIRPNTCFITVMLANNETGIIQPVDTIGALLKDVNQQRKKDSLPEVLFHTDAAQALGKVAVNVEDLKVDYLSIAGHKFYGPRTGALYFRNSKPLYPLLFGAGQERGLRPGTPNTCMIAGVGTAAVLVSENLGTYHQLMKDSRDYLEEKLKGPEILAKAKYVLASTGAACHHTAT
ncbi:hypothetical protein HPB50_009497 [Hyalomma asiaticum]|uniref:Uncharacterized protein n=1 Tax=Hyalomma asiaticum TaxID=266040 RepID=A0ACB7SDJ9_HYAAI|nr:hypothetical protein HPB50_009497 [Hyalomma asiaticum]